MPHAVDKLLLSSLPGRPRLLLIEDDSDLRTSLPELLTMEGYDVACAADGAEALSRILRSPLPSVIVLDLGLPRIDGFAFRTVQLQSAIISKIPTITLGSETDSVKLGAFIFRVVVAKTTGASELLSLGRRVSALAGTG